MIRVFVDVGPLGVQLLGQRDVGVRLDGEGLADGEHLEEEREVIPESRPWEVSLVSGWWDLELQCISDIRPEVGPGKIGLITNMALYQMLLRRGLEKGWKDSNELRWESGSKNPMIELLAP